MGITMEGSDFPHRRVSIRHSSMNRLFSPKDWREATHRITMTQSDGIFDWIDENIKGWWEFEGWIPGSLCCISFTRAEEAMAFKLRWL